MHLLVRGGATRASSVMARRGRDVAVFDTGMGHSGPTLVAALRALGVTPEDVTFVFNTHAHVDHSHNNILFTRAAIVASERDRAWTRRVHEVLAAAAIPDADDIAPFYPEVVSGAFSPKIIRKVLGIEKLLWDEPRIGDDAQALWLERTPLPRGIRVIETPGHSPHHVSYAIDTGAEPVIVCGDALLLRGEESYTAPMMPPWSSSGYLASRTRLQQRRGMIVPGHDEPYLNR